MVNYKHALELYQAKQYYEALKICDILRVDDESKIDILLLEGQTLVKLKRYQEATTCFKQVITIDSKNIKALNYLGYTYFLLDDITKGIKFIDEALSLDNTYIEALNNKGIIYQFLNKHQEAIDTFTAILKSHPNSAEAYFNMSISYNEINKDSKAVEALQKAISIRPNYINAYVNLSLIMFEINEAAQGLKYAEEAFALNSNLAFLHHHISDFKNYTEDDKQLLLIKEILKQEKNEENIMHYNYVLYKAYNDTKNFDKAFQCLGIANRIRKKQIKYNIADDIFDYKRLVQLVKNNLIENLTDSSDKLIFVVGMPRSGTTLVEQILSSHHQIFGAGELDFIYESLIALEKLKFQAFTKDKIKFIRDNYINHIKQLAIKDKIVTNKLPLNFIWLPFIFAAFPNAKIIHIQREPIATCWSNLKNYFNDKGNAFIYSMTDVASFYILYQQYMNTWEAFYPNRIHTIKYEDLINDEKKVIGQLLNYCGLGWDNNCLEFYKNKRQVKTVSNLQVRKPIYKGSNKVWKNYEKHLTPMIKILNEGLTNPSEFLQSILHEKRIIPTTPSQI